MNFKEFFSNKTVIVTTVLTAIASIAIIASKKGYSTGFNEGVDLSYKNACNAMNQRYEDILGGSNLPRCVFNDIKV